MLTRGLGALRFAMGDPRSTSAGWGYPWSTCTAPLPAYACCSGSWQPRSTATCSTCGWRSIPRGGSGCRGCACCRPGSATASRPGSCCTKLVLDVRKDYRIWEHHRYRHDPVFSKGDSDIYRFRRYSRQFYPGPNLLRLISCGEAGETMPGCCHARRQWRCPEPPGGVDLTLRCPDCDPVTPARPLRFGTRLALCALHQLDATHRRQTNLAP